MKIEHVDNRMPLPNDVLDDHGNLLLMKDGPLQQYGQYGSELLKEPYAAICTLGKQTIDVIVLATPDEIGYTLCQFPDGVRQVMKKWLE